MNQGPIWVRLIEKSRGQKSRATVPFKVTLCIRYIDLHSFHSVCSMNTNIFTLHMWLRTRSFYSAFLTNTHSGNLFKDLYHSTHSAYLAKAGSFIRPSQQMPMVPFRVLCEGEDSLILCIWGRQPNKSYTFFYNSFLHLFKGSISKNGV
jgi:hypothetical protein